MNGAWASRLLEKTKEADGMPAFQWKHRHEKSPVSENGNRASGKNRKIVSD
jgi:hypothetical protein